MATTLLTSCQQTFQEINESYSVVITPEFKTLACDSNQTIVNQENVVVNYDVYLGNAKIANSGVNVANVPSGVTSSATCASASAPGAVTLQIPAGNTLGGASSVAIKIEIAIPVGDDYVTINKYITLAKVVPGEQGDIGDRGLSLLKITTAPDSYTTKVGNFTPKYKVSLSTVKTEAKVNVVNVGDTILQSYYTYPVGYVDATNVYLGARTSIRGATGAAGVSAVMFSIYSADGDTFTDGMSTITIKTHATDGITEITDTSCTYNWYKYDVDYADNNHWSPIATTQSFLQVSRAEIINVQTYKCIMTYSNKTYEAHYTLKDTTDVYTSEIKTIGGTAVSVKNPYVIAWVAVYKNGEEIDPICGEIWDAMKHAGTNPSDVGDYYYLYDNTITLKHFNGTSWGNPVGQQTYTYNWYNTQNTNSGDSFGSSKVLYLDSNNIIDSVTLECNIVYNQEIISKCQMPFVDLNDPIVGGNNPGSSYRNGQLWIDTSANTPVMKVWDGFEWSVVNSSDGRIFTSKPETLLNDGYCYKTGDLWVVGSDYQPTSYSMKTILIAQNDNTSYSDADWICMADIESLRNDVEKYQQVIKVFSTGLYLFGAVKNASGGTEDAKFYACLTSNELGFYQRDAGGVPSSEEEFENDNNKGTKVVWISDRELHAKSTTIEDSLKIVAANQSSLPSFMLGDFIFQIESNGSLSLI